MNKRTRVVTAIAVVAVLTGSASACSEESPKDMETARRAQAALDSANEALEQERDAETKLIRKCMNDQGFKVFPSDGANSNKGKKRSEDLTPTPETARTVGYGADPRRSENQKAQEVGDDFDALPEDVKRAHSMAMDGYVDKPEGGVEFDFGGGKVMVPSKGCRGETLKAVYGDVKEYLRLNWTVYNTVKQDSARILGDDDAYQKALSEWASCMKAGGYPEIPTPEKAREAALSHYANVPDGDTAALDNAQRAEIKQATTDADCGTKVGLNTKAREAKSKASADSLVKHEAEITAWLELITKAKAKAQELLRETS
ncbi:hypothetical protein ACFVJ8_14290 [Streptomyces yangpuensis]|uniref:hypothetical protein n=1 Tax=Streptomyces TaxID=1883 RepID=UPI000A59C707|nr:hypothetical protein [Streptomyces sp. NRRL S-378]